MARDIERLSDELLDAYRQLVTGMNSLDPYWGDEKFAELRNEVSKLARMMDATVRSAQDASAQARRAADVF